MTLGLPVYVSPECLQTEAEEEVQSTYRERFLRWRFQELVFVGMHANMCMSLQGCRDELLRQFRCSQPLHHRR